MSTVLRVQHVSVPMPVGGNSEARAFYGGKLGLTEVTPPSTLNRDRLVWYALGSDGHELHVFAADGSGPNSPSQHLCFQVDDLEGFRQRVTEHGIEILPEPEIHNRPRFSIRDPFKNRIEITQITGAYDEFDS
jgi:catechol 2,3-dioxygenase-like lactoylglutathione lyase family enzyme